MNADYCGHDSRRRKKTFYAGYEVYATVAIFITAKPFRKQMLLALWLPEVVDQKTCASARSLLPYNGISPM